MLRNRCRECEQIKTAKDWDIRPLLSQFGHFFGHFRRKRQHGTTTNCVLLLDVITRMGDKTLDVPMRAVGAIGGCHGNMHDEHHHVAGLDGTSGT